MILLKYFYNVFDRSEFEPIWVGLMTLRALLLIEHVWRH